MRFDLHPTLKAIRPCLAGLAFSLLLPALAHAQFPYGYRGYNVPNLYTGIDPYYSTGSLYYPGYSSFGYSGYGYPGYSGYGFPGYYGYGYPGYYGYGYPGSFFRRSPGVQLYIGGGLGGLGLSIGRRYPYYGYGSPAYSTYGYGYPGYSGFGYPGGYYQTYMRGYSFGPGLGLWF